jgi:uncharacterized membrane protein HdeD (DUF308 family)
MEWIKNHRTLLIMEGILFSILGILAIILPGISTLSTELFIGWLLIFGAIAQLYRTFTTRKHVGFTGSLIIGFLYLIFGILLLLYPVAGILSLTVLLIFFFFAEGIGKLILAFQFRRARNWGWLAVNGVLAIIIGYIIWAGWPQTSFWALGLLVGINMLFFGLSLLFLGFALPSKNIGE